VHRVSQQITEQQLFDAMGPIKLTQTLKEKLQKLPAKQEGKSERS
jgi:hypothetical protein